MKRFGFLSSVLALVCLVYSASQAVAAVPARTTTVTLQNKTDKTLYLTHFAVPKGSWTPNLRPPAEIKPGATGSWKSEAGGVANLGDIEGNVRYAIGSAAWRTPTIISPANAAKSNSPMLSLSHSSDAMDVFFVAPDGSVQCMWHTLKANKWSAPYVVAPAGSTRPTTALAGVCRAAGHMDIFWITKKGEIATKAFANGKWGESKPITGPDEVRAMMNLSVVSNDKNWIDVFYVGADGSVKSCSWRGAATWVKPASHSPANSVHSELTAITRTKDEIHVFYKNQEGGISSVWWRGKWNGPGQVTGKSTMGGSRIDAVAMNPKHLAVFWANPAGTLCTTYAMSDKDNGKWNAPYPLSAENGAFLASPIVALNRSSTEINVFWRTLEGAVMANGYVAGGQWGKAYSIAPAKACSSNITSVSRVSNQIDVFWVDQKGCIVNNGWEAPSIYISWRNPLVDSQYKNTYHEQAPTGFSLFFTDGQGSHAKPKFVLEKSTPRMVPGFSPSSHGFKFPSTYWKENNIKIPVIFVEFDKPIGKITLTDSSEGLCGGMSLTAMDYFLAKEKLPGRDPAPVSESDPLYQYIRLRQLVSWDITGTGPNFLKFMRPDYPDADEGVVQGLGLMKGRSYCIVREEWPKIKAEIDAKRLTPMGLVQTHSYLPTDLGKNHQVLVYGYQLNGNEVTLFYYDPGNPRANMELRFTIGDLSQRINLLRFKNGTFSEKKINMFFRMPYVPPSASMKRP